MKVETARQRGTRFFRWKGHEAKWFMRFIREVKARVSRMLRK